MWKIHIRQTCPKLRAIPINYKSINESNKLSFKEFVSAWYRLEIDSVLRFKVRVRSRAVRSLD